MSMAKNPGECDEATCEANQTTAKGMVGKQLYALTDVRVVDNDTTGNTPTITVMTANSDGSTNTDVLSWSTVADLWAPCPSTLPSSAQPGDSGPPPPADTSGQLYLSTTVLAKHRNITTLTRPKWPLEFGADQLYYQNIKIWPTKIVVYGVELEDGVANTGYVDLLDPKLAQRGQQLTTDHLPMTLSLTPAGCASFHVTYNPSLEDLQRAARVIQSPATSPDALSAAWDVVSAGLMAYHQRTHPPNSTDTGVLEILRALLPGQSL
jgi:hypothetical protein